MKNFLTAMLTPPVNQHVLALSKWNKKLFVLVLSLLIFVSSAISQVRKLSGRVTDNAGLPLSGVNVTVEGTKIATSTNNDGYFEVEASSSKPSLIFSHVGFATQKIKAGQGANLQITLTASSKDLDQVVVVGYGTQKKANLTGAVDVISNDVFKNRAPSNVGSLLQGVSPNLNIGVTQLGGEPGSGNTFNIRGIGTLSGEGAPLILVDGFEMDINNLDPESIENVTILKDAASAAVYGSRAPFGVVLITTKKGSKNKGTNVGYSNNFSFASPLALPKWQSSLRYVTAYNEALENSGLPDKFGPEQIDRIKAYIAGTYKPEYDTANPPASVWAGRHRGNANYNWFDLYFKKYTVNQKHNISISGGDQKNQYYVSMGYYDQGSAYNWSSEFYKRYNAVANITSQATTWLRFNASSKFTNAKQSHPNLGSDFDYNRSYFMSEIIKFFPTTPYHNVDGTINNPYVNVMQQAGAATGNTNDLFVSGGAEIEPVAGWKTNLNYNYNYTSTVSTWLDHDIYAEIPTGEVVGFWGYDPPIYTENFASNHYNAFNATSSYEKRISSHFFKIMGGYERESKYISGLYGQRAGLISLYVPSLSTATGPYTVTDNMSHWGTEAFFGRFNYNFKEKYLLELNGRYNGSSRFAKDSRWGFFPSVSAGYNISKEPFWEPIKGLINDLKIRGSYGSLGNQNVPNYLYLSTIPITTNLSAIVDGVRPNFSGLPNIISPTLTWETVKTLDVGIDAHLLNNRLGFSFDWFDRKTLNMFGPATILPATLGTAPPQENNASLDTKGWEVSIDWKSRVNSNLGFSAKLTLADSKSQVTSYLNETGTLGSFYKGRNLGEIWGYATSNIIQTQAEADAMPSQAFFYNKWGPGDIKYTDLNKDGKIDGGDYTLSNHGDLKVIGNSSPRYTVGFNGAVTWKNFDFSMFWQGIMKRDLWPTQDPTYGGNVWWGIGTFGNNGGAFYKGHDNYWRPANETNLFGPNTNAFYAKPYTTDETIKNQQVQTRYLLSAAYFRLKSVQIAYNLPVNLVHKLKLQGFKMYVAGENLLTFTSSKLPKYIDPETAFPSNELNGFLGAIYPVAKSISFGLNVTF